MLPYKVKYFPKPGMGKRLYALPVNPFHGPGRDQRVEDGFFRCLRRRLEKRIYLLVGQHLQATQSRAARRSRIGGGKSQEDITRSISSDAAVAR